MLLNILQPTLFELFKRGDDFLKKTSRQGACQFVFFHVPLPEYDPKGGVCFQEIVFLLLNLFQERVLLERVSFCIFLDHSKSQHIS